MYIVSVLSEVTVPFLFCPTIYHPLLYSFIGISIQPPILDAVPPTTLSKCEIGLHNVQKQYLVFALKVCPGVVTP